MKYFRLTLPKNIFIWYSHKNVSAGCNTDISSLFGFMLLYRILENNKFEKCFISWKMVIEKFNLYLTKKIFQCSEK